MKRLYRIKIFCGEEEVFDGFYEGRILRRIKEDALKLYRSAMSGDDDAELSISHEPMTLKPAEFYKQLGDAEAKSEVIPARVKGIGQRWAVVKKS